MHYILLQYNIFCPHLTFKFTTVQLLTLLMYTKQLRGLEVLIFFSLDKLQYCNINLTLLSVYYI